jgi:hypothetical protein
MSGAIQKALDEVKFRIPPEILEVVFNRPEKEWRTMPFSIDELITAKVIRPRVLVDCNLVGGKEMYVPLDKLVPERADDFNIVYRIPKTLTGGRSINSVLNITYGDPNRLTNLSNMSTGTQGMTMQLGAAVMGAMGPVPLVSNARVELIAENTVLIRDTTMIVPNQYLRCVISNDKNLSDMPLRVYRAFATMVELAVKSYIYINFSIALDRGQLRGGMDIGKFKDFVEGYADSEELYQTYVTESWQKIALMMDVETWNRHLKRMIGGNR